MEAKTPEKDAIYDDSRQVESTGGYNNDLVYGNDIFLQDLGQISCTKVGPRINSTGTRLRLLLLESLAISMSYAKFLAMGSLGKAFVYEASVTKCRALGPPPWDKAVRILLNLNHHNVLSYLAIERRGTQIYVAEQCTSYRTIQTVLDNARLSRQHLKESVIWEILQHILVGLAYLHMHAKNGIPWADTIVHGAIVPHNIVLLDDEVAVLGGCALWYLFEISYASIYEASRFHVAPEVIVDPKNMSEASDIWSVGSILYTMLTLEPLVGETEETNLDKLLQRLYIHVSSIQSGVTGYSDELVKVLCAMLHMDPRERPSVNELLREEQILFAKHRASRINESLAYTTMRSTVTESDMLKSSLNQVSDTHTVLHNNATLMIKSRNIDIIHLNARGETPLMEAVKKNNFNEMISHLNEEARVQTSDGMTALMFAALFNNSLAITHLIDKEARIVDNSGNTALIFAVQTGFPWCAKLLLPYEEGMVNNVGETALMYAVERRFDDLVQYLSHKESKRQTKNGDTALIIAVRMNYHAAVQTLAPLEGHINLPDGASPEALATSLGFNECADIIHNAMYGMRVRY